MQSDNDTFLNRILSAAIVFAAVVAAACIGIKAHYEPQIFQLRFNVFALLSATALLATVVLVARMIGSKAHSEEASWFLLVMFGSAVFSGSEMMQRLSATPPGAIFWSQVGGFGVQLLPAALLLFAAAYTRPPQTKSNVIAPLMITVTAIVSLLYAEGNLIFNNIPSQIHHYAWGYNNAPGPAASAALLWFFVPIVMAVILLLRYSWITQQQLLQKQSRLYAIAIAIPIGIGLFTDGVLPTLNVNGLPPLASIFEVITIAIIFYGMSKYRFFQINPAILADSVLKTMNEAVIVTRPDYKVEFLNKEAERLLGVSSESMANEYIHRIFTPEAWPRVHDHIEGTARLSESFDDIAIVNHEQQAIPVRVFTSSLMESEQYEALVFVISDISDITESYNKLESDASRISKLLEESHRLEQQLAAEKAGVEHTVEVRTKELVAAQERLKESDKLKTEFIMLGSHNLRTPIAIMADSLEALKSSHTDAERAVYMRSLEHGVSQLRDFVEDMVTISSLEAGADRSFKPVTAADLLKPIVADFEALASSKPEIAATANVVDGDVSLQVNAQRLRGGIGNLVSNAFKFTESGSITLEARQQQDSYLVRVTDTGIGISAEELPRVFTKFHRATDTLQYSYEGKGIGLYLVKLIAEEHGGTVTVESTLGKGSTFTISLPIA